MRSRSYKSLLKCKKPVFDGDDFSIYDFRRERGTYVYRNLKSQKFTPIDENLIKESKRKITSFLQGEYRRTSELFKCKEVCRLSWKRYSISLITLLEQKKISVYQYNDKTHIKLLGKRKPRLPKGFSFLNAFGDIRVHDWLEKIQDRAKKRNLEEYKRYRETYGR